MVNKMLLVLITNVSYDYSANNGTGQGESASPLKFIKSNIKIERRGKYQTLIKKN
jgi:hypothetical protein